MRKEKIVIVNSFRDFIAMKKTNNKFTWFKMPYIANNLVFDNIPDVKYRFIGAKNPIRYKSVNEVKKIELGENDFKEIVLALANLDYKDINKILEFTNTYGLLGLFNFLKNEKADYIKTYYREIYTKIIDMLGVWYSIFGFPADTNYISDDPLFWYYYKEDLRIFQYSIREFQQTADRIANNYFYTKKDSRKKEEHYTRSLLSELDRKQKYLNFNIATDADGKMFWYHESNSLLGAAYSFMLFNVKYNYPLRKCKNCSNFFWADDLHHQKEKCKPDCGKDRTAQRNMQKDNIKKEVIEFYKNRKNITPEEILKQFDYSRYVFNLTLVKRWIKEFEENKKED